MKHLTTTTELSGDVSGNIKMVNVSKLRNLTLDMSTIADGRLLSYNSNNNSLVFTPVASTNLLIQQIHNTSTTLISTTSNTFVQSSELRYTTVESGNYLVKFTGAGGDVVTTSSSQVIYAIFMNNIETPATRRQFGAIGTSARGVQQIYATHYYFKNVNAGTVFSIGFSSTTGGNIKVEGRNLTVIKI